MWRAASRVGCREREAMEVVVGLEVEDEEGGLLGGRTGAGLVVWRWR